MAIILTTTSGLGLEPSMLRSDPMLPARTPSSSFVRTATPGLRVGRSGYRPSRTYDSGTTSASTARPRDTALGPASVSYGASSVRASDPGVAYTPSRFSPFYAPPAPTRRSSGFGPPMLDRPSPTVPTRSGGGGGATSAGATTYDDFVKETDDANVNQGSPGAQDVIKTDEGGASTDDVPRFVGSEAVPGPEFFNRPPRPVQSAGMSTGKKVAIGVGVGLAAVALFSFFR